MIYSFDGYTLPYVESVIAPLSSRIPSADTPARPGTYQGRRQAGARTVTVVGTLTAASYVDLRAAWSDLQAAHDVPDARHLVIRDGWFVYALPDSVTESDVSATNLHYQADYKLSDPYSYSNTLSTQTLNVNGTTVVAVGGNKAALPTVSVVVATAPPGGSVLIWNQTNGEKATLYPSPAQQYRFNSRTEKMELGLMYEFTGQFISLAPGNNTISVTASGGTVITSASISWRNRSL